MILQDQKILISPLDWGLGHATRCIPIINYVLEQTNDKSNIHIASSGRSLELLKQEYPDLQFHEIVSYDISYQEKGNLAFSMMTQLPKLLSRINKEHQEINSIVLKNKIDVVLSDNRFGAYSKHSKNVFITHQLDIQTPNSLAWTKPLIRLLNYQYIKKYDACWIPDHAGNESISGALSKPFFNKPSIHYLGNLSRFQRNESKTKYDVLAIISGPEPQRTIFENMIRDQFSQLNLKLAIVLGKPESKTEASENNIEIYNHLNATQLNQLLLESKCIISRAGYSTIMDLIACQKQAILIPTPGQTEQEYLGKHLSEKGFFYSCDQKKLDVKKALKRASNFSCNISSTSYIKEAFDSL